MVKGTWNRPEDRQAVRDFLSSYQNVGEWEGVFEDATLPEGAFTLDRRRLSLSSTSHQQFMASLLLSNAPR